MDVAKASNCSCSEGSLSIKLLTDSPISRPIKPKIKMIEKITITMANVFGIPFFFSQFKGARLTAVKKAATRIIFTMWLACLSAAIEIITPMVTIQKRTPPTYCRYLSYLLFSIVYVVFYFSSPAEGQLSLLVK